MKQIFFFLILLSTLFIYTQETNEKTLKDSNENRMEDLQKHIDELAEKVKKLKQEKEENQNGGDNNTQYLKEDVEELMERMNETERTTLVDRIRFSLDFRSTVNNYIYKDKSKAFNSYSKSQMKENFGLLSQDGNTLFLTNMRMRLKMVSRLNEKFKFTAWLTMYKGFNTSGVGQYDNLIDLERGYYPDGKLWVERAYIDYFLTDWFALTLGRLPTTDGYPHNIKYDSVSLGTANEFSFNIPFDALFLTLNLDHFGVPKGFLRALISYTNPVDVTGNRNLIVSDWSDHSLYVGLLYEMMLPGLLESKLSTSVIYIPEMHPPIINYKNVDTISFEGSMADILLTNMYLEFQNIQNSGLTLLSAANVVFIKPHSRVKSDEGTMFIDDTPVVACFGSTQDKTYIGYMIYAGIKYALPFTLYKQNLQIGADYNYGNKYYYNRYIPDTTGFIRYSTRGHFFNSYFLIPVHRKAHIKVGYIFTKHNYESESIFGSITDEEIMLAPINEQIQNIYMMINIEF